MITFQDTFTAEKNQRFYDYKLCFQFIQEQGKKTYGSSFQLNVHQRESIYKLLIYAIKDEKLCKKHGIDVHKSVLIMGPSGCGKTSLFHLIKPFFIKKELYVIKSSKELSRNYFQKGFQCLDDYDFKSLPTLCIDDIGLETIGKHYGTNCDVVLELLDLRWGTNFSQLKTHLITSLDPQALQNRYGIDFRTKLKVQYNVIVL